MKINNKIAIAIFIGKNAFLIFYSKRNISDVKDF